MVVRHLVADAVGRVAERDLGEIARADHHGLMKIGGAKQERRALARLHILEGDVIAGLPAGEGMPEILEHLPAGRTNVDFLRW